MWDVTRFLPSHPGGIQAILKYAGQDATAQFDPIHPQGTLEDALEASENLGAFNNQSLPLEADPKNGFMVKTDQLVVDQLLSLDEIESEARKQLSEKAWVYYSSASDDQVSKRMNYSVWSSILLRPRVFIDCTRVSTHTKILGHSLHTPVFVSPAAMARMAHPSGELGIAQACGRYGACQIVSSNASMSPEQVVADAPPGQIFGWQTYVQSDRSKSEKMLARINQLSKSFKFIVLTLDAPVPGKREDDERINFLPTSRATSSQSCHNFRGVGKGLAQGTATDLTWEATLAWFAKHTNLPIVLKGISGYEDALLASQFAPQVQAVILSNHGGRAMDTAPPSVYTLIEIRKYCPEVLNKIDILIDGGVKRGTDVVKALCLGAKAVGVGRAPLYGLAVGGREGVERMFQSTCL